MTKKETKSSLKKATGFCQKTYNLLFHDDIYYRIGGLLIFGLLIFAIVWVIFAFMVSKSGLLNDSFLVQKFFKPEIIRTIGPWAAKTFGTNWNIFGWNIDVNKAFGIWGNVLLLMVKNFLNHLVFIFIFIFFLNRFKIGRWNLGLIYFALYTIMWGMVVGTNSMTYPLGNNLVVGSLMLFLRYGLWIWFSYLLLVVSTTQMTWCSTPGWLNGEWQQTGKFWPVHLTPDQWEVLIYGLLFLLAASFAEARIFVHYNFL